MTTVLPVLALVCCKKPFNPPAIHSNPGYLVVDGFINNGNDSTYITLSRTRNLSDADPVYELNAEVSVSGESGETIPLQETGKGRYAVARLNLNEGENYQLHIVTSDGKAYESDEFQPQQTPLIDSLSWRQDSVGVGIYAYTHDETGNTRYYRWSYDETWEYHTAYQSLFDMVDGTPVYRTPDQQIYHCWSHQASGDILLASTERLSKDVVNQQFITEVPRGSEKIALKYSIQVTQYAITAKAFTYWQNLKQNTEQLGTLFDVQPSQQVGGNIHCLSTPSEPVLGYIGASSITQKRIFITNDEVPGWYYSAYYSECFVSPQADIMIGLTDLYQYLEMPHHLYTLLAPEGALYEVVENYCGDCRVHGGSTIKPAYWQ